MSTRSRYSESRDGERIGDKLNNGMNKKYGKSKEIPPFINRREGYDDFTGKDYSIEFGGSTD